MIGRHRADAGGIRMICYLALFAGAFAFGFAQGGPAEMPDNAYAKSNGNGWRCNQGYREVGRICVASGIPIAPRADACCGMHAVDAQEAVDLEAENVRLRAVIDDLSLKNAVLRSEQDDDAP